MMRLVDLLVEGKGLVITLLPGAEVRAEVETIAAQKIHADTRLAHVLEWHLCNSSWTFVAPKDVSALTDAPILSDEVRTDEYGDVTSVGRVFWWVQYDVKDPVETLLRDGQIMFEKGSL